MQTAMSYNGDLAPPQIKETEEYSIFHPRCSKDKFLSLIEQSDIILDSLNWSGGNSSLEAISLNKPIVTCPSEFMRGRHTYSILRKLNVPLNLNELAINKNEWEKITKDDLKGEIAKNFLRNEEAFNKASTIVSARFRTNLQSSSLAYTKNIS